MEHQDPNPGVAVQLDIQHESTRHRLTDALKGLGVPTTDEAEGECLAVMRDHQGPRTPAPVIRLLSRGKRRCGAELMDQAGWAWLGGGQEPDVRTLRRLLDELDKNRCLSLRERFDEDAVVDHHTASKSADKLHLIRQFEQFAADHDAHPFIVQGLTLALDEMFSNAIYDAPVDDDGKPLNRHAPRSHPVESPNPVQVIFAADSEEIGITVRDSYGSLPRDRVLERLRECYATDGAVCETKEGGAGLGLFLLLENASTLSVQVQSGQYTEVTITRKLGERRRNFMRSSPTLVLSFK
jgi:hypothetical protein